MGRTDQKSGLNVLGQFSQDSAHRVSLKGWVVARACRLKQPPATHTHTPYQRGHLCWVPVLRPTALLPGQPYGATSTGEMRWWARQTWGTPWDVLFIPKVRKGHPCLTPFFSWVWSKSGPLWLACPLCTPRWRPTGSQRQLYSWGSGSEWEVQRDGSYLLGHERKELKQQDQQIHRPHLGPHPRWFPREGLPEKGTWGPAACLGSTGLAVLTACELGVLSRVRAWDGPAWYEG